LNKDLQPGHIVVLAGGVSTGKSFANRWLLGASVGGSVDATPILMRHTSFNAQAGTVAHFRVDDAPAEFNWQEKRKFSLALKARAANPTILYMPKFKDAVELPHLGRVVLTMNTDPESLSTLPALDGSIADKISLFRIRDDFMPDWLPTNAQNEARALSELPYFLRWLLNWTPPDEIMDSKRPRYGVKAFHHPKLVEEAHVESAEYSLQELLEPWITAKSKDDAAQHSYTATEILAELQNEFPGLTRNMSAQRLSKSLTKLIGSWPYLKRKFISSGTTKYQFDFTASALPF
jgi:hypothetical protein